MLTTVNMVELYATIFSDLYNNEINTDYNIFKLKGQSSLTNSIYTDTNNISKITLVNM